MEKSLLEISTVGSKLMNLWYALGIEKICLRKLPALDVKNV